MKHPNYHLTGDVQVGEHIAFLPGCLPRGFEPSEPLEDLVSGDSEDGDEDGLGRIRLINSLVKLVAGRRS